MVLTYEEAWNAQPDGRSREEIFQSILLRVKERAGNQLSDVEAHVATYNLIAFCRELIGLKQDEAIGNIDIVIRPAIDEDEHE